MRPIELRRGRGAIVAGVALSWVVEYAYNSAAGMNPAVYAVLMDTEDGSPVASYDKLKATVDPYL